MVNEPTKEELRDMAVAQQEAGNPDTADRIDAIADKMPEVEEEVEYPKRSKMSKLLDKIVSSKPVVIPDLKFDKDDEEEDEQADLIDMSPSDEEFLFSTSDPMIEPPTAAEMEDLAGSSEDAIVVTQEEQEAKDKAELGGLIRAEEEEAKIDEHIWGMETDGTAGSAEPVIKTTRYTVALKNARARAGRGRSDAEIGGMNW